MSVYVVNRNNIWVRKLADNSGFALKALMKFRILIQRRLHDFKCDSAPNAVLGGKVNSRHTATVDFFDQGVAGDLHFYK